MEPKSKPKAKGSWGVRFFILVLGITLGILFFWLLNFLEGDVDRIKGLRKEDIRSQYVDAGLDQQKKTLNATIISLKRRIQKQTEQQTFLQKSTSGLQKTINQLLSIQKESLAKDVVFPEESVQTLKNSQAAFLENQQKYQQFNQELAKSTEQMREKEDTLSSVNRQIAEQQEPADAKYKLRNAIVKLGLLVPIFLVLSFLFMKFRASPYWPLVWSTFIAAFIKIAFVANEYFDEEYFKYIALLVILAIVLRLLIHLIRMIIAPKKDLLIKQYQQLYDKCLCPVCTKPIRTGPLRYIGGLRKKSPLQVASDTDVSKQQVYTCPSCGSGLYHKCEKCDNIRHTLLPYCEHCGTEHETEENNSVAT